MGDRPLTNTTDRELKPCPFCGGSAVYQDLSGAYLGHNNVVCRTCKASTYDHNNVTADAAWNRRDHPPASSAIIAVLKKVEEHLADYCAAGVEVPLSAPLLKEVRAALKGEA